MVASSGGLPVLQGRVVAFDVETNGSKPHLGHRIFCWAYKTDAGERGFMRKTPESIEWLRRLFMDKSKVVVMHNMKFELKMLSAEGINVLDLIDSGALCEDTLILSKVLNSVEKSHDLRTCAKRYLGLKTDDKDEIKLWLKPHNTTARVRARGRKLNFTDVPSDVLMKRVLWDVDATLDLYFHLRPRVIHTCPKLYETERQLVYVCADMEMTGVLLDLTRARELQAEAQGMVDRILEDLRFLVGSIDVPRKQKGQEVIEHIDEFNPGSNAQLEAAFRKLGIELKYKTKPKKDKRTGLMKGGGSWAFDEYAMIRYVSDPLVRIIRDSGEDGWRAQKFYDEVNRTIAEHDLSRRELLPPLVLKYREQSKMISTYYSAFIREAVNRYVGPDGREYGILHCKFNQSEAMTGRFSSSEPNLQNIPRILGPRECFVPRKGRLNWHIDFSQVEMRMFVHFAQDKHMAAEIDRDIHLYVATRIYNKPREQVSKEQRKRAKSTGFGILYGSGAETQAETLTKKGLPTSVMEAKSIVAAFHREFPSVKRLTNSLKAELARRGYIENPFGRRYYIPTKFGYKALNYKCQGTPADLIKASMVKIWRWLRQSGLRAKMLMQVHDELVIEACPADSIEVVNGCVSRMENRTDYFVPITVEVEVTKYSWSQKLDPADLGYDFSRAA